MPLEAEAEDTELSEFSKAKAEIEVGKSKVKTNKNEIAFNNVLFIIHDPF